MPSRPLIGLTTSELRDWKPGMDFPHAEAGRTEVVLGNGYMKAIADGGGAPLVMPPLDLELVPTFLAGMAGVCLSGGPDIDPETYGEPGRSPKLGPTEPVVDRFEVAVVHEALRLGMPVLAICRGAQLLNVALGGTLYQHLPDDVGTKVRHRREDPGDPFIWHEVDVVPGSLLAGILGCEHVEVNSFHHQAPRHLGEGIRLVGTAPDGVSEGIELDGAEFVVGVQWHPEGIVDRPEQAALFSAFAHAAHRYAARTASTAATAAGSQAPKSSGGSVTASTGIR